MSPTVVQFVCVISMSAPDEETKTFKGTVSGEITRERRERMASGMIPFSLYLIKIVLWQKYLMKKKVK